MKYSHIERDETATQLQRRLSRQGAQALMRCGPLVTSRRGKVDLFIKQEGNKVTMSAVPRMMKDKELSAFLWKCHAGNMTLHVTTGSRLEAYITGDDQAILQAMSKFDSRI